MDPAPSRREAVLCACPGPDQDSKGLLKEKGPERTKGLEAAHSESACECASACRSAGVRGACTFVLGVVCVPVCACVIHKCRKHLARKRRRWAGTGSTSCRTATSGQVGQGARRGRILSLEGGAFRGAPSYLSIRGAGGLQRGAPSASIHSRTAPPLTTCQFSMCAPSRP